MRNDARPIGERARHAEEPESSERAVGERQPKGRSEPRPASQDRDADREPTMPSNDATLRTKI